MSCCLARGILLRRAISAKWRAHYPHVAQGTEHLDAGGSLYDTSLAEATLGFVTEKSRRALTEMVEAEEAISK